ncbi:hypothetical protein [Burkholderia anthina]|uniref:hypothetical protein n=1 Tax=Burkholderia anthina TaxID=179879 RepID=UPI0037C02991
MKTLRVASLLTGMTTLLVSGAAMAGVNVGINVGVPAPVYVAPAPVYAPPPPVVYQPAPMYAPAPAIVIGWHGDRYWDGRRYWGRDEWNRHHGRGWGGDRDRGHGHGDHGRHGWH